VTHPHLETPGVAWRSDHISAAGIDIARFETGAASADAPAILLLHGLGHWTGAAWDRIAPLLDPAWRIVGIDLPGFGESERPDARYDLTFFRAVLADVVRQTFPGRFALAGHSLGGMIAADYAATYPDQIDHLVLIAPAGFASVNGLVVRMLGSGLVRRLFSLEPRPGFVLQTLRQSVRDPEHLDPDVIAQAQVYAADPTVRRAFGGIYSGTMQSMRNLPGLHAHFARYRGPALVIWGQHDRFIPVKALANAQRVYPQAELRIFDQSGHVVMDDEPAVLAEELRAFLDPPVAAAE
jgi:pimeloyl-ACP methyl ester carboxylesterase